VKTADTISIEPRKPHGGAAQDEKQAQVHSDAAFRDGFFECSDCTGWGRKGSRDLTNTYPVMMNRMYPVVFVHRQLLEIKFPQKKSKILRHFSLSVTEFDGFPQTEARGYALCSLGERIATPCSHREWKSYHITANAVPPHGPRFQSGVPLPQIQPRP